MRSKWRLLHGSDVRSDGGGGGALLLPGEEAQGRVRKAVDEGDADGIVHALGVRILTSGWYAWVKLLACVCQWGYVCGRN